MKAMKTAKAVSSHCRRLNSSWSYIFHIVWGISVHLNSTADIDIIFTDLRRPAQEWTVWWKCGSSCKLNPNVTKFRVPKNPYKNILAEKVALSNLPGFLTKTVQPNKTKKKYNKIDNAHLSSI